MWMRTYDCMKVHADKCALNVSTRVSACILRVANIASLGAMPVSMRAWYVNVSISVCVCVCVCVCVSVCE